MTLPSVESESIKEKFEDRKLHALKLIHLGACLLDPRSQGLIMSAQEQIDCCKAICQIGQNMNISVKAELAMYRPREGLWGK